MQSSSLFSEVAHLSLSHLTLGRILVVCFSVCRKRCPFMSVKPDHLKAHLKHGSPRLDSKVCSSPQQREVTWIDFAATGHTNSATHGECQTRTQAKYCLRLVILCPGNTWVLHVTCVQTANILYSCIVCHSASREIRDMMLAFRFCHHQYAA